MDVPRSPDRSRYPLLALFKEGRHSLVSMVKGADGQVRVARLLLQPSGAREVDLLEGVARVARQLKGLQLPHVVGFDQVVEGAGGTWMLFHFAPGTPLGHYLGRESTLPEVWVYHWISGLLQGLQALHTQSPPLVLGFLEPFDIVVAKQDVTIVDLGLFERIFPEISARGLGSHPFVSFIAPERRSSVQVTATADLFSVGAIAFWLLSGQAPVVGQVGCRESLSEALRSVRPTLPAEVESLVLDLLSFYPSRRPASAAEALERLRPFCVAPQGGPPEPTPHELLFAAGATRSMDAAEALPQPVPPVMVPAIVEAPPADRLPVWQEALEDVWWASRRRPLVVVFLLGLMVAAGIALARPRPTPPAPAPTILDILSGDVAVDTGGSRHHDWRYTDAVPANSVLVVQAGQVQAASGSIQLWIGPGSCLTCVGREGSELHLVWSCGEMHLVTGPEARVTVDADSRHLHVEPGAEVWLDAHRVQCKKGSADWGKAEDLKHLTAPAEEKR